MLGKTTKLGLCRTIEFQSKQQVSPGQKVAKGTKLTIKNAKGKNTTSMLDLHKAAKEDLEKPARNLTASKHLTYSKESQEDASHKAMLQQELEKFRKEIELRFRRSETNRSYVFPRENCADFDGKMQETSCMGWVNAVVKVMTASTMESSVKIQRNVLPKSRDSNYYSTFCNIKKPVKPQQRAESGDRKLNSSSKLSTKIQNLPANYKIHLNNSKDRANHSKDHINKSREITFKSIKKVLIKNINLQNKLNTTQTLHRAETAAARANLAINRVPGTCSKSPVSQLKERSCKLAKDMKCAAGANSEYYMISGNNKKSSNGLSSNHKGKRNGITVVKSTSSLKDIPIG
eukprot:TRINITY_DN8002_c0_g3_i1.p1 TRINITY_DN8002_c0_g3~~TRINITY_DN8002_c0_g3_i1.p1  ORF type:complete len:346 (+),score=78.42 TRINITY_DN8002_c0_g3_i1:193-1230(+)